MTLVMWAALAVLAFAILFFITEWLRVDVVAFIVLVALMLTGLLTTNEALSGFSNPVVLTIAALFVVGGAVMQTGLAEGIGRGILRISGTQPIRLVLFIMLSVGLISAFISNTGTVAVLLPAIISLARKARISPSKLLMPMAFGSSLGGALTLIGTPPNLIVSGILRQQGLEPFGFFDFAPVGSLLLAAGVLFTLLVGRKLLPERETDAERAEKEKTNTQPDMDLPGQVVRLVVKQDSRLAGKNLAEVGLRSQFEVNVLEIQSRLEKPAAFKRFKKLFQPHANVPDETPLRLRLIRAGDILLIQGKAGEVDKLAAEWGLMLESVVDEDRAPVIDRDSGLAEVLLLPYSQLEGKDVVESQFASTYGVTVLGIERPGVDETLPSRGTSLRFGDTLLVRGPRQAVQALRQRSRDFVVVSQISEDGPVMDSPRALMTLVILAGMMLALVSGVLTIAPASMLAALAIILTGCLSIDDAYQSVDWKSIVLIAGMLPMAIALEKVGLVNMVANGLVSSLGVLGPLWVMAGFFLLTALFTQVLSNTTTAVLLAPVALIAANKLGVQPQAFLMAVALAASMSFATPVSSPVNTLVMGAGNYRFSDYMKAGVPLILVCLAVAMLALPVFWPFQT